jgi:hypothetical protein
VGQEPILDSIINCITADLAPTRRPFRGEILGNRPQHIRSPKRLNENGLTCQEIPLDFGRLSPGNNIDTRRETADDVSEHSQFSAVLSRAHTQSGRFRSREKVL